MECRICFEKFDKQSRKPISISCGHSFCLNCLINLKQTNYKCPTCREPIINQQPNYIVMDLLESNLIVDPDSQLKNEINNTFNEIEQTKKERKLKLNQSIKSNIDSIKTTIDARAEELINKIKNRKELLIKEADSLQIKMYEKVDDILNAEFNMPIDFEKMNRQELENLKMALTKTKHISKSGENYNETVNGLFGFELDEINPNDIGRFTTYHRLESGNLKDLLDSSKNNVSMSFLNDPSTNVTPLQNRSKGSRDSNSSYNSKFITSELNQTYYYKTPEYMMNPSTNYPKLPAEWTKPNQIQNIYFNNSTSNINSIYKK